MREKIDIVYQGITHHPDLLPETIDPEGSTRYSNVKIYHEQIQCKYNKVHWFDSIEQNNTFIIQDQSPDYEGYKVDVFKGTVLKEKDGQYSWWRSLIADNIPL